MEEIAQEVEKYIQKEKEYPENLAVLVEKEYTSYIPVFTFDDDLEVENEEKEVCKEYIYKVEEDNGKKYFVIECPRPEVLVLREKELGCPKRLKQLKYIQGKGIVMDTE